MEDRAFRGAVHVEDLDHLSMRVTIMYLQTEATFLRERDVIPERTHLRFLSLRSRSETVKSRLPDDPDAWVRGQRDDFREGVVVADPGDVGTSGMTGRIVRVEGQPAEQCGVFKDGFDGPSSRFEVAPDRMMRSTPTAAASCDPLLDRTRRVPSGEIEVGVVVRDGDGKRLGSRQANPPGGPRAYPSAIRASSASTMSSSSFVNTGLAAGTSACPLRGHAAPRCPATAE